MADNRQLAYVLALVGGLAALASAFFGILIMTLFAGFAGAAMGGPFWWSFDGPAAFTGIFALIGLLFAAIGVGTGVVMLVAAPRLRSDDPEVRRKWAIWCLVAGGVAFVGAGGVLSGALGAGAGLTTLLSDQDARASP